MRAVVFGRQVASELLKARRRSLFISTFIAQIAFAVFPAVIGFWTVRGKFAPDYALTWVTFPHCLWSVVRISQYVFPIIVGIIAAGSMGGEYASGTWKMILPRVGVRTSVLFAKFLASMGVAMVGLWCTVALGVCSGFLGATLMGVPFLGDTSGLWGELVRAQAFFLVEILFVCAFATLMVVLTRSFVGGVVLGSLGQFLLPFAAFLPFGWVYPGANLQALEKILLTEGRFKQGEMESVLGGALHPGRSFACVMAFTVVFMGVALWLFARRDMVSE